MSNTDQPGGSGTGRTVANTQQNVVIHANAQAAAGHLHTKTMNRLQAALLEHDFVIQYKKVKLCLLATYPGCHLPAMSQSMKLQKVSIPFNLISMSYKRQINSCRI